MDDWHDYYGSPEVGESHGAEHSPHTAATLSDWSGLMEDTYHVPALTETTEDSVGSPPNTAPTADGLHQQHEMMQAASAAHLARIGHSPHSPHSPQSFHALSPLSGSRAVSDSDVPDAEPEEQREGEEERSLHLPGVPGDDWRHQPQATQRHAVLISEPAWQDLETAARSVAQADPVAAGRFLDYIEAVLTALAENPTAMGTYRPAAEFGNEPALAHLHVFYVSSGPYPCDIFYRAIPDPDGPYGPAVPRVEVVRVLHGAVEQPWLFPDGAVARTDLTDEIG